METNQRNLRNTHSPPTWPAVLTRNSFNPLQSLQSEQETIEYNDNEITPSLDSQIIEIHRQRKVQFTQLKASNEIKHTNTKRNIRNTSKQENKSTSEKDKPQRIHPKHEATKTSRPSKVNTRRNDIYVVGDSLLYDIDEHRLNTKNSTVRVHCFPGASLEDMIDFVKPIARKKPTHPIIHWGTNNLPSTELSESPQKIKTLLSLVKSISQDTFVMFSGIITRVDSNGKYIDKVVKVMDVLEKLSVEVIDNWNIKSLGKGNAKLATNLKQVIKNV